MQDQIDKLRTLNGELCEEINRQERRIRELESLVRDMWEFGESSNYPYTPLESARWAQMREEYRERIAALGIEVVE